MFYELLTNVLYDLIYNIDQKSLKFSLYDFDFQFNLSDLICLIYIYFQLTWVNLWVNLFPPLTLPNIFISPTRYILFKVF